MKKLVCLLGLAITAITSGQIPDYYNDVNLNLSGTSLQNELAQKVINSQSTVLSYTPGVWDALKVSDRVPGDANRVILIYGYDDTDGVLKTDRTRGRESNGGDPTDWNREHVFPRSLGNPNLGSTGPGSDAHHLRPSDPAMNSSRSNRKFAAGTGNAAITPQGNFYPGDEFKGDVARMMLYMYIRYGNRCLPNAVGVGTTNSNDGNMVNLFLDWNAEDPVNNFELNRNEVIAGIQGNRNPFIDNPAFATQIWGGPQAEDRFGDSTGGGDQNPLCTSTVTSFPYSESFEGNFGVWNQASAGDDFNWTRRSGGTPSSNTGPSGASQGNDYIYMESSTPNFSTKRAILYGPCYDLNTATNANFTFKYHMYGASNMGSLSLETSTNGTTWTPIWSQSGNQGNAWRTASVNLDVFAGSDVQLRFNGITGTTWQGDMAVDDLIFSTTTGGGNTSQTVDVDLRITFDNYPEETSWELRNANNDIVFSGGTYGSQADGSTINLTRTLEEGCYNFIIRDTYGDGICCSYGNGSYELKNASTNSVIASGGAFTTSESTSFCLTTSLTNSNSSAVKKGKSTSDSNFEITPNPASSILDVKARHSQPVLYSLVNSLGQQVATGFLENYGSIDVSALPRGIYIIKLSQDSQQFTKRLVLE